MALIKKVSDWLIYSSQNPEKISLTLKGAISLGASFLVFAQILPAVDQSSVDGTVKILVELLDSGAKVASALILFFGLIRKIKFELASRFPNLFK